MSEQEWGIHYYTAEHGRIPFREWFGFLKDKNAKALIDARLARLRLGNFGKCEPVCHGVFELKIYYGPGYRVYFGRAGIRIVLLLCGGKKSTQRNDIRTAHDYWQRFEEHRK